MRLISYDLGFSRASDTDPTRTEGPVNVTVTELDGGGRPVGTSSFELAGAASYESSFTRDADQIRFVESGTVTFDTDDVLSTLAFVPVGEGYLVPPADPSTNLTPGVATWSVNAGSGFFEGATGTITSVFAVDLASNGIRDRHLALIMLPDEGRP